MAATANQRGDRLIWLAAAAIVAMAAVWLFIEAPWSGDQTGLESFAGVDPSADAAIASTDAAAPARVDARGVEPAADPLSLARLALAAGMLTEPADYSAWTLFADAISTDPANTEAREGLQQVAAALAARAEAAFEQGRYADASALGDTILARLPNHVAAIDLVDRIELATREPEPEPEPEPAAASDAAAAAELVAAAEPETAESDPAEPVDPIPALFAAFEDAMARNSVLTPPGSNAHDIVRSMLDIETWHAGTMQARDILVTEMLDRSTQSIEAMDIAAARTWIDSTRDLAPDPVQLRAAEARLHDHLIAAESQKLVPVSELTRTYHQAPEYPPVALRRGVEGWVEVGFVVSPDGETEQLSILAASNGSYFGEPALAAVEAWRFEPVVFMGQAIARRSFTRLAFVID